MSDMAALERRYRRMLIWFPAEHRRLYGEEMVGVLLASTPEDQDRPTRADTFDLIGGGLRIRIRQWRTGEGNPAWRDALAVFSVVAPVVLLGWLLAGYLANVADMAAFPFSYKALVSDQVAALLTVIASAVVVAALAICPVLARRHQVTAAAVVGVIAIGAAVFGLVHAYVLNGGSDGEFPLYLSLTAVMEVLALLASPGPARGWQLLSHRGLIVLAVISVVAIGISTASATSYQTWNNVNTISDVFGVITVLGAALTLRWPVGSRLMGLWAIPGYQFLGFAAAQYLFTRLQNSWIAFEVLFRLLPTVLVAGLVGLAAWRSSRRGRHGPTKWGGIAH